MLDTLRNSARGTAGKVIVGLITLTFVLFGAESIISIAGARAPATVNGEDISEIDFQRSLAARQQELVNQLGPEVAAQLSNSSFLQQDVLNNLVEQRLQSQLAINSGFYVGENQILNTLGDIPAFHIEGQFDQNRYLNVISANGFDHQSFLLGQQAQAAINQFQAGLALSAFSVERQHSAVAILDEQTRTFAYQAFSQNDFVEKVELTSSDVELYYSENNDRYMRSEQIDVDYFVINQQSIADEMIVTEAELATAYESYVAEQMANENREISHILFAEGDTSARALDAITRLNNGEAFSDLASELSDDVGSADFGGSLGAVVEGIYVDEFYQAAIALSEVGEVSEPVETEFGVHLIQLDALSSSNIASLDEVQSELETSIKSRKARSEFVLIKSDLADAAFSSDSIKDLADEFQSEIESSGWLERGSEFGVFAQSAAASVLFSSQVIDEGLISDVVELDNGDLLVFQQTNFEPEAVKPLAEVEELVRNELTNQAANTLMLEAIKQAAEQTTSIDDSWALVENILRTEMDVPVSLVDAAFSLAAPSAGKLTVTEVDGGEVAYVLALSDVNNPVEASDEFNARAANYFDQFSPAAQYQLVFNSTNERANIKLRQ